MATSNTTPVVIPQPIAAQATSENINSIPNGATGTNRASFQEGFPAITRMPVIENPLPTQVSGLPPKQQDFNGLFNAVSQHNFFAQNGGLYSFNQAVSDAIGGYPQGALLWAIVGGKPSAVYSLIANNTFNFLTNPEYLDGVHWAFIDSGLPTGTIITWSTKDAPDGYLICNGAAISRTTYARLFAAIGTTWGAGDGNTTFNVPNFTNRYLKGGTAGTYGDQTLPNVKGEVGRLIVHSARTNNPFYLTAIEQNINQNVISSGGEVIADVFMDLSRSNAIYGRSDDVNPYNAQTMFCIRY